MMFVTAPESMHHMGAIMLPPACMIFSMEDEHRANSEPMQTMLQ